MAFTEERSLLQIAEEAERRSLYRHAFRLYQRAAGAGDLDAMRLAAGLLEEAGRLDEAIGWYGSIAERSSYELVYLAPAQLRLGQIYDERGDLEPAIYHYRRFRQLWRDPEPELRSMVEQADRRLRSLAARGR